MNTVQFRSARPVWELGACDEMNINLVFRASFKGGANPLLRISGHALYSVYLNGELIHTGPARAGHGYFRVDELELCAPDGGTVTVICSGYRANSYYLTDCASFFCAELERGGVIIAYTAPDCGGGFAAWRLTERVQRVQRYSFQRPFTESYRIGSDYRDYFTDCGPSRPPLPLQDAGDRNFISRDIFYPELEYSPAVDVADAGSVTLCEPESLFSDAAFNISEQLRGWPIDQLEECTVHEAQHLCLTSQPIDGDALSGSYRVFAMERNLTGLITLEVDCRRDTVIYLLFDELFDGGCVNYTRLGCSNVVKYRLGAGVSCRLITLEPYTFKYIAVVCTEGEACVRDVGLRRVGFPAGLIKKAPATADARMRTLYTAAVETFRQNTFDIYMDCPSRERAGWLCDSFFTSRVEYCLTGKTQVENNFLENFLMPEKFTHLPDGMLPMCYPSDHYNGVFIPNWAMWYLLELYEYRTKRGGDSRIVELARDKMYALLSYFRRFEGDDGLLRRLESWVFIEWSHSNNLTQDINYPSNMLYALFKERLGQLYGDNALITESEALRYRIREQSRIGMFYCDNSYINDDGSTRLSGERTESCQYYAFFTRTATPESDPELWSTLVNDFGPHRQESGLWSEIWPANAFIGNYLRLDLLCDAGYKDQLYSELDGYFTYMAEKTGTIWENTTAFASCNHGFASHVAVWLDRLGFLGDLT